MVSPSCNPKWTDTEMAVAELLLSQFGAFQDPISRAAQGVLQATAVPAPPGAVASEPVPLQQRVTTGVEPPPPPSIENLKRTITRVECDSGTGDIGDSRPAKRARRGAGTPGTPGTPFVSFTTPNRAGAPNAQEVPKHPGKHYPILPERLWTVDQLRGVATCRLCGQSLLHVRSLTDKHQDDHKLTNSDPIQIFPFICGYFDGTDHCRQEFPDLNTRNLHSIRNHQCSMPEESDECPVPTCRMNTASILLPEHMTATHHNGQFCCGIAGCESRVSSIETLNVHMKRQHCVDQRKRSANFLRKLLFDSNTGLPRQQPFQN